MCTYMHVHTQTIDNVITAVNVEKRASSPAMTQIINSDYSSQSESGCTSYETLWKNICKIFMFDRFTFEIKTEISCFQLKTADGTYKTGGIQFGRQFILICFHLQLIRQLMMKNADTQVKIKYLSKSSDYVFIGHP